MSRAFAVLDLAISRILIRVHFDKSPLQCFCVEPQLHKVYGVRHGEIEDAFGTLARTMHKVDAR